LLGLWVVGCHRGPDLQPRSTDDPGFGYYRVAVQDDEGHRRRFRMLLHVATPDRIHAEILTPVGTTVWILDAGNGRLSMTDVRHGEAWVGDDDGTMLGDWIGVRLTAQSLVGAILEGVAPNGWRVERQASPTSILPESLEVEDAHVRLTFDLRRIRPLGGDAASLGTGRPPPGVQIHELDRFPTERIVDVDGEAP